MSNGILWDRENNIDNVDQFINAFSSTDQSNAINDIDYFVCMIFLKDDAEASSYYLLKYEEFKS